MNEKEARKVPQDIGSFQEEYRNFRKASEAFLDSLRRIDKFIDMEWHGQELSTREREEYTSGLDRVKSAIVDRIAAERRVREARP